MNSLSKKLVQSAGALAVAALLAACGGGDVTPPVETVPPRAAPKIVLSTSPALAAEVTTLYVP